VGGRAGEEGDVLSSSVSEILYYIEFGTWGLQKEVVLFVKLFRWDKLLGLWEDFWSLSFFFKKKNPLLFRCLRRERKEALELGTGGLGKLSRGEFGGWSDRCFEGNSFACDDDSRQ